MSRKLAVLLAMVVLTGAMGLKSLVAAHTGATLTASIGGAPRPIDPWK